MTTPYSFWWDETGVQSGQPIRLLDFACGDDHWRYTTCAYDIVWGDETYSNEPGLVVGATEQTENDARNRLEVMVPWSNALIQELHSAPPDNPISLTQYKMHTTQDAFYQIYGSEEYGDGVYGGHSRHRVWYGWVLGHEMKPDHQAVILCSPYWSDVGIAGTCMRAAKTCQVPLGSTACGVDLTAYEASGTITSVDGVSVVSATFGLQSDGYYEGGVLETADHTRLIVSHTSTTVILSQAIPNLAAGATYTVTPGCDHIWASDCKTRFTNKLNFRGQPHRVTHNMFKRGVL